MKTIAIVFCAIFLSIFYFNNSAIAQNFRSRKLLKDAEKAFYESNYAKSAELCKEALDQSPGFEEAKFLLGRCFYEVKNPTGAEKQFLGLLDSDILSVQSRYWLALSYKMLGQYELSIQYFDEFLAGHVEKNKQSAKATLEKEGAILATENKDMVFDDFEFQNAGARINSDKNEFSVSFGDAPNKIIINSFETGSSLNGENLKFLYAQGWMRISENDEFDFLNTPGFEGPGSLNSEGDTFYFTQCQHSDQKCRIMVSKKVAGTWMKATPLPQNINPPESSTSDPVVSINGDTLFFVSDRRGGLGDTDIWFSVKEREHSWSDPINLGQPINTPYKEISPFVSNEGAFYFSSDGHPGFGGMDIFYTTGLNGKRQIINAGAPFNSSYDDQYMIVNEETGFLSSNRTDGHGAFDIYTFVNNRKEDLVSESDVAQGIDETVYSSLFASELYEIETKFIGTDIEAFDKLNNSEKKQLHKEIEEKISTMTLEERRQIKKEDEILYASLSREKRFFVDRLTASYFESKSEILPVSDEDLNWFTAMEISEQRKLYRLMAAHVHDVQQEFITQNTPLITDEDNPATADKKNILADRNLNALNQKSSLSLVEDYEDETYTNSAKPVAEFIPASPAAVYSVAAAPDGKVAAEQPEIEEPKRIVVKEPSLPVAVDEISSPMRSIPKNSLDFYQGLSFTDRKKVDRIMAIKLVNEKYVLNPGLSFQDENYYTELSASEKETINRLRTYFKAWDATQESAVLKESDLLYLTSLPEEKSQIVKRIIVRRGMGIDNEKMVKFGTSDWERYKKFSDDEIEKIKEVAGLLRNHGQVFDVALAYAGEDYRFNNDLALRRAAENKPVLLASSDPEMVIEGMEHRYESVYFNPGDHHLRKEAVAALNELVAVYQNNPEIFINLSAFSADLKSEMENARLSELRAKEVKRYMEGAGVPDYKVKIESHSFTSSQVDIRSLKSLKTRKLDINILNSPQIFESRNTTYLVQPGNTLYSLAKANNVSIEELMAMNGLTDYTLFAYQPLRVKREATLDPELMIEPSLELLYADSEPAEENEDLKNKESQKMSPERGDDILVIQVNEEPVSTKLYHLVKKGEKLKEIAKMYSTDEKEIMKLNRMRNKRVKAGEKLLIKK